MTQKHKGKTNLSKIDEKKKKMSSFQKQLQKEISKYCVFLNYDFHKTLKVNSSRSFAS